MGRLDAFQGLSLEEERAQGLYDAPCTCCGEACSALSLDRDGRCPDCDGVHACCYCGTHADDDLPIDADGHCPDCADVPADAIDWLCAIYDHAAAVELPWHLSWDGMEVAA